MPHSQMWPYMLIQKNDGGMKQDGTREIEMVAEANTRRARSLKIQPEKCYKKSAARNERSVTPRCTNYSMLLLVGVS